MKRFPWRFALYFALGLWLAADLYVLHGPVKQRLVQMAAGSSQQGGVEVVARVYGRAITRVEHQHRLRELLFLRGEDWAALSETAREQLRQLALEELIERHLITAFRIMNGLKNKPAVEPPSGAVDDLLKELEQSPHGQQRLADQKLSTAELHSGIASDALDATWLEEKIAHRMAEITEDKARAWFDEHLQGQTQPERWQAAHLFLSGHEPLKDEAGKVIGSKDRSSEMAELHAELLAGTDWQALCAKSEDERSRLQAGQLGWFTAERMPPDFIAHLRQLNPGEVSAPVRTRLGWHLIKLTAYQPAREITFAERKEELLLQLQNERRAAAIQSLTTELKQRALSPTPFIFRFPAALAGTEPNFSSK